MPCMKRSIALFSVMIVGAALALACGGDKKPAPQPQPTGQPGGGW